ncbi:MAG TPA: glycoside hydrolase family 27 protein [Chitinophaga sp.]|uniref:glycoside hydrolase family 27 protein n=1 Tax=Chitinophaga sp. TaxID=1869181 RepID=UPI002DB58F32|nr:glycoside hydrolase family 27 protein [Chitinophaga sp.]HEU4553640.1 glycoside hydrolase family 27 protein [Chitinophaga sp.]
MSKQFRYGLMTGCLLFFISTCSLYAQTDSLALTPPMGWNSWNLFEDEVSETLVKEIADAMVSSGMLAAGYTYIVMDDFWVGGRDAKNRLYADRKRFPNGIKALADYVHGKGLKLGIYSDAAPLTCGGVTGSYNFEELDAQTFADWGIDYLKYDYCNAPADVVTAFARYKKMGDALKQTHRPIVYSICEWGQRQPWLWAKAAGGHLWRTTWDIRDTWRSKEYRNSANGIMNVVDKEQGLEQYAGPGGWNDPDLLVLGLFGKGKSSSLNGTYKGCTLTEYRTQFTLWCMLAAPLMVNLDVRHLQDSVKAILLDKDLIAINQDALGKQASRVYEQDSILAYRKELSGHRIAVCVINVSSGEKRFNINADAALGLHGKWNITHLPSRRRAAFKGTLRPHESSVYICEAE